MSIGVRYQPGSSSKVLARSDIEQLGQSGSFPKPHLMRMLLGSKTHRDFISSRAWIGLRCWHLSHHTNNGLLALSRAIAQDYVNGGRSYWKIGIGRCWKRGPRGPIMSRTEITCSATGNDFRSFPEAPTTRVGLRGLHPLSGSRT